LPGHLAETLRDDLALPALSFSPEADLQFPHADLKASLDLPS
jgi:hypothetical protein